MSNFWHNLLELLSYDPKYPMLFNSGAFFILFTVFLLIYSFLSKNRTVRTAYIIAFSLYFYYKASGWYLLILWLSIVVAWWLALLIERTESKKRKRLYLILAIVFSIALLVFFKYTDFFLQNIGIITGTTFDKLDLFLPIGISFFTFQTLSYLIDVHRGEIKASKNFLDYGFYMSFFPHLVAGPIVRARFFLPQLQKPLQLNQDDMAAGLWLIIRGLVKKAIIADYLAQYNDLVFASPSSYSGFEVMMAIYGYTLQIFCDFSGYSDMAIGIAKLMGYQLGDNFNSPYKAGNITEFWRRWHISLTSWFRDYLFFPLALRRKNPSQLYMHACLIFVFLVSGLWHGPAWKFVFWGGMHGVGLALHKLYTRVSRKRKIHFPFGKVLSWLLTFHFVVFLWVFFRASGFHAAWGMITSVFTDMDWAYFTPFVEVRSLWITLFLLGFLTHFTPDKWNIKINAFFIRLPWPVKALILLLAIQFTVQLMSADVQPFIYFQF
ncbi:MAG: MBOAT family protein [Bacteroidota bacterium]